MRRFFAAVAAALLIVTGLTVGAAPASAATCGDAACAGIPTSKQAVAAQLVNAHSAGSLVIPAAYPGIFPNEIAAIANNTVTPTCDVDIRALQTILIVIKKFGSATITDLNRDCSGGTDATCPGSPVHCVEGNGGVPTSAIDFGSIGGLGGPSASSASALFSFIATFVPQVTSGAWTEALCGEAAVSPYMHQFFVSGAGCDHHHIDYRGTPSPLNLPAPNSAPTGNYEGISSPSANSIVASGWAADFDTPAQSVNVAASLDGVRVSVTPANLYRSDVKRIYPQLSGNNGFAVTLAASPGSHTVAISAIDTSTGAEQPLGSRTVTVTGSAPTATRVEGSDRYETAAAISRSAFPGTAPAVYIASGQSAVDVISASSAAAKAGGPLLLNDGTGLQPATQTELQRLSPSRVYFVGGASTMPDSVIAAAQALVPGATVTRLGGTDRFETSRNVIRSAFTSTPVLFVVDSNAWTDGLPAGNMAAFNGEPVLIVNGPSGTIDAATTTLIRDLAPGAIRVVGGPAGVSDATLAALGQLVSNTLRVSGSDRFTTAVEAARRTYGSTGKTTAYIVSGVNYADGMSAALLSGKNAAPLFLSRADCVDQSTLQAIYGYGVQNLVLIGGTATLTASVAALKPCGV
ncbi:cell wall-binding repeat-containing protein [Leifsonia sp. C5G2]|uniref:cell wall-binding repeat-containing protein n=1 Tax=Leifsonia sp. C5G2 TaxID=2735269 RepID=UPI001585C662|nr:cell wall-binding repeat-containing protein [Leifsonia sp. C5G2]NUU07560.1 cell wall-binding repeat-containing protein [Leifsonia sp. C5G2]